MKQAVERYDGERGGEMRMRSSHSMFGRIMAVVLSAVLVLTVGICSVCMVTLRNQQISSRLSALTKDAREIAYLASQNTTATALLPFGSTALDYLRQKAGTVQETYGAYILVVDRRGRVMDNMQTAYAENPEFVKSLNAKELSEALTQVLSGEEVTVRAMVGGRPTFTVGVPFMQNGAVLGAVLIQTQALNIEGGIGDWLRQVLIVAAVGSLVAAVGIFLYVRNVLQPLNDVTQAARAMADGDFSARVETERATPETIELASAFNLMADKLGQTESSRREFVANVSHELRSPITSIAGFVTGMEDGTIPPEEHGKYLAIVGDETRRLSKLIGDLLALSRLERDDAALTLTEFDACELLRRCVIRRINDLEGKHMEVVCDFQVDPCQVRADPDRIEQVVVNLLDNAIKFTPEGGCITLATQQAEENRYQVRVRDNGIGILPEDRPRVFERFFTADRAHTSGKGTGLGLAISQRIMEMHGSQLVLEDTQEGTAFSFALPKAD